MAFFEELAKINTNSLIMKYVVEHKNNKKTIRMKKNTPYILYIKGKLQEKGNCLLRKRRKRCCFRKQKIAIFR